MKNIKEKTLEIDFKNGTHKQYPFSKIEKVWILKPISDIELKAETTTKKTTLSFLKELGFNKNKILECKKTYDFDLNKDPKKLKEPQIKMIQNDYKK